MNDARRGVARTACSVVGAYARYHTRRQSALPPPLPLPPLRALRPSTRQRERGGERAPPSSALARGGEEIEIMNDVRGDAARAARNSATSHAASFDTRPGYRSPAKAPATALNNRFLSSRFK